MTGMPITVAPLTEVPYGLGAWVGSAAVQNLTGADPLDPTDRAFGSFGYQAEGEVCRPTAATTAPEVCEDGEQVVNTPLAVDDHMPLFSTITGKPFRIEAGVKCSTFGQPDSDVLARFHAASDRALDLLRWQLVAFELWTDTQRPSNNHFDSGDDPAVVLAGGVPVSPVEAMSLLADSFGVYLPGGPRLIHAPVRVVPFLDSKGLLHPQGSRLYDVLGNGIIADDGYPGTGPGGEVPPDGQAWMYATGPLTVRVENKVTHPAVTLEDAVDPATNDIRVRSFQGALATFLCGKVAVLVNLSD